MATTQVISPTDIISGMLVYLSDKFNVESFPTNRRITHAIIYDIKNSGCKLLDDFSFDTSDMFPYSPIFDEALANIQACNDLQRKNPEMANFYINPQAKSYFDNILQGKFENQLTDLEELAKQFAERLDAILKEIP